LQSIVGFNGGKLDRWRGFVSESRNDNVSSQFSSAFPLFGSQIADCPNFISELITLMVGEADELAWLPRAFWKPMVVIVVPCFLPEGKFHVGNVGGVASESFR